MNRDLRFVTTQWTLVWQAASQESTYGKPALAEIVQRYWRPLYSFARQRGLAPQDAEDATQDFLSEILNGDLLSKADPAKGLFRTYLLTAWKRFLIDQHRKENALKRGGQSKSVSLDYAAGEQSWLKLADRGCDPDRTFMMSWADSILEEVKRKLQEDYRSRGRIGLLESLWPMLTKPMDLRSYEELAAKLSLSPSAVKVALHRLRQRFGETLREVVGDTVEDASEVEGELQELLSFITLTDRPTPT